jgi:hypothetical protein
MASTAAPLLGLLLAAACAAARPPGAGDAPPWQLPAAALGSQRLYRVAYSEAQGEGSFRLTLHLAAAERYQVRATDPVGRALWTLDVDGARGLLLDHRSRAYCLFSGRFDLSGVPLAPFPLGSLPGLLLGRLPVEPAGTPRQSGAEVAFADAAGRRWQATLADGVPVRWTAWEGDEPAYWWARRDGWAILSDRRRGVQVRWREVLVEPLVTPPAPLVPPEGYRQADCAAPPEETPPPAPPGAAGQFDSPGATPYHDARAGSGGFHRATETLRVLSTPSRSAPRSPCP